MTFFWLDIFCGLGGVSDGAALEGFDVLGIDIEDMPLKGYKHKFLRADIRDLKGEDYQGYDVVWGSPPCRDFTRIPDHALRADGENWKWKHPKDPESGLKKVRAFLKFVEDSKPVYWILENVSGLASYLKEIEPRGYNCRILNGKRHVFYGNYPQFLMPHQTGGKLETEFGGKLRSWERAKIPLACSRAFARAIHEALEEKVEAV